MQGWKWFLVLERVLSTEPNIPYPLVEDGVFLDADDSNFNIEDVPSE